jgi:diguanylate cyclase (GGDEF)-like protein/PAS domain S-box-containing protein
MPNQKPAFTRLDDRRREQAQQALARLAVIGVFAGLWWMLWFVQIPMPVPFLLVLMGEAAFFLLYLRGVSWLPSPRSVDVAEYIMLGAEIVFHTTIVYFLGGVSWLGSLAYVFGLIFANTFLDAKRGFAYTAGASVAFASLLLLEATGVVPHYQYLEQGQLRYQDPQLVATTIIGGFGVFFAIHGWVNWVGRHLREERDTALRTQDELLRSREELQTANHELTRYVEARTIELERTSAALRESEERLRSVITTAPVVLFSLNRDGVFTLFEGKGIEALGLDRESLVGHSAFDIFRQAPQVLAYVERALTGEAITVPLDTGSVVYETRLTPVKDEDSEEIVSVIGVAIDVTEQKHAVRALEESTTEQKLAQLALEESEQRFRRLAENAPDIIFRYTRAEPAGFEYVSPAIEGILGYTPTELYAEAGLPGEIVHPDDRTALGEVIAGNGGKAKALRWHAKDGTVKWLEARVVTSRGMDGRLLAVEGVMRDVTEQKRWEDVLRESESKFRAMADTVSAAVFIFQGERMRYVNRAAEEITGYREDELLQMRFWEVIDPASRDLVRERGLARQQGKDVPNSYEVKLVTSKGEPRYVQFTAGTIEFEGEPAVLGTAFDITERKRAEDALHEAASHDYLTGLLNRRAGFAAIEGRLASARETGGRLAFLALDVDNFKRINDSFGHDKGDIALRHFASVMKGLVGDNGLVCRLGGDEFEIALEGASEPEAVDLADKILRSLRESTAAFGEPELPCFTASAGIGCYPEDGRTLEALRRCADDAMYAAKAQGGDRYVSWRGLSERAA